MRRAALMTLPLLALPAASWAQPAPSDAQAQALHDQVLAWVTQTFGPDAKIPAAAFTMKADGDHYVVTVPLDNTPGAPSLTADAKPVDDGRWTLTNLHLPSPATFHVKMPNPGAQGGTNDVTYTISMDQQSGQTTFDPAFKTPLTSTSSLSGLDLKTSGGPLDQTIHVDSGTGAMTARPSSVPDHSNVSAETDLQNYQISMKGPGTDGQVDIKMGHVHLAMAADDVSGPSVVQLVRSVSALTRSGTDDKNSPAYKAVVDQMLGALTQLMSGLRFQQTMQDTSLTADGETGTLRMLTIGLAGQASGDRLAAKLDLGAEGLTLPEMGLGASVQFIPTKLTLRPTVTGISVAALNRMIEHARQSGDVQPDDAQGLFADGGFTAGLENLALDVAGSQLRGEASVKIASLTAMSGTGHFTLTNLDQLQQKIAGDPDLAQGGAVLIFLKGIGKQEGDHMLWDVSFAQGKLLVNNQDMSAMLGAAAGGGDQPPDVTPDATPAVPERAAPPPPAPPSRAPARPVQPELRRRN